MKKVLNYLFDHKTLSRSEAKEILIGIGKGEYNSSSVSAFLSVYLMRSISVEELSGFRDALLELCVPIKLEAQNTIDIVGTGGDNKNTFNISTLSCFVVAANDVKVTKHGNYGVSSVSGSSNVLERCGIVFTNDVAKLNQQVNEAGICFMHAPLFHPAMKTVAPIRKELAVRTFFNLLGPLVNPSQPENMLLGTYNLEIMRLYNYLLQNTNCNYAILHSFDGFDEVSLTGQYKLVSKKGEEVFDPIEMGLNLIDEKALYGGDSPEDAAKLFMHILKGNGTVEQNSVVAINSAHAITCVNQNISLIEAYYNAIESLKSGKAFQVYQKLIACQN